LSKTEEEKIIKKTDKKSRDKACEKNTESTKQRLA
jgi:hypothetical protein